MHGTSMKDLAALARTHEWKICGSPLTRCRRTLVLKHGAGRPPQWCELSEHEALDVQLQVVGAAGSAFSQAPRVDRGNTAPRPTEVWSWTAPPPHLARIEFHRVALGHVSVGCSHGWWASHYLAGTALCSGPRSSSTTLGIPSFSMQSCTACSTMCSR